MEHVLVEAKAVIIAAGAGICSLSEPELLARLEALYLEGVQSGFNINNGVNNKAIPHPDDIAVDKFAEAMKKKMAVARGKGRSGWENKIDCPESLLQQYLATHLAKGDPVDVGNFAMMLFNRDEKTIEYNAMSLFDGLRSERDNAWHELCKIRVAIKANPEESTFDEVARLAYSYEQLKVEISRHDDLREKLDDLLSRTAIAFRGPEPLDTKWSWHDLPYLAQQSMVTLRMCADKFRAYQQYHEAKNTDDSLEKAKVNAELVAVIEHVISCDLSKSFDATNEELAARQRRPMSECKTCGWTCREGDLVAHSCTDFLKLKLKAAVDAGIKPVIEKPARIGSINFMPGVELQTVLDAANRRYLDSLEPTVEAERIEKARVFITLMQGDPDKCRSTLEGTLSMLKTCKFESGVCMCGYTMGMHGSEDHSACDSGSHYAEELATEIEDLLSSSDLEKEINKRAKLAEQSTALHAVGHLLELPAGTDVTTIPSILKKVGFFWVDENGKPDGGPFLHQPSEAAISRAKNAGCDPVYIFALQSGVINHG